MEEYQIGPAGGQAVIVRPGLEYTVYHVYCEQKNVTNSVIQALTVKLACGIRPSGENVAPTTTGTDLTNIGTTEIYTSAGKDVLLGDMNARHRIWDGANNQRGRAVISSTEGTMYQMSAPG